VRAEELQQPVEDKGDLLHEEAVVAVAAALSGKIA
jgi:hypothetical protein